MARFSWRRCFGVGSRRNYRKQRRTPARPGILMLEDRLAPAILTVNSPLDTASDSAAYLTLREAVVIVDSSTVPNDLGAQIVSQISGTLHQGGNDTIDFDPTQVTQPIVLAGSQLELSLPSSTAVVTIDGGAAAVTVDGNSQSRVFLIDSGATVSFNDLTITDGSASSGAGGGILNSGTLSVTNSTFTQNAAHDGGGISNTGGTLSVTNSTFTGNAAYDGGGFANDLDGTLSVTNCTITSNSASDEGGGIDNSGELTLTNNILANNTGGDYAQAIGAPLLGSNNLVKDGSFGLPQTIKGQDPLLGTLDYHGGPTETLPLLTGSPAIGKGASGTGIPTTDQRGLVRIGPVDVGAFQLDGVLPQTTTVAIGAVEFIYGQPGSATVTVTSAGGSTPTGSVTLTVDSGLPVTQSLTDGFTAFSLSGLSADDHSIQATYNPTGGFIPDSGTGQVQVLQAQPTVTVSDGGAGWSYAFGATYTIAQPWQGSMACPPQAWKESRRR